MAQYSIQLDCNVIYTVEVEADTEDEAVEQAKKQVERNPHDGEIEILHMELYHYTDEDDED